MQEYLDTSRLMPFVILLVYLFLNLLLSDLSILSGLIGLLPHNFQYH